MKYLTGSVPRYLILTLLIVSNTAFGNPPLVTSGGEEPGLLVLFQKNAETEKGRNGNITSFGILTFKQGSWDFTDGRAGSTTGGALRYRTTDFNGNYLARDENKNWVVQIKYKHTGPYNNDGAWYIKNWSSDLKMISLQNDGGGDNWSIRAGNASDGWDTIVNRIALGTDYNTFTFVFNADGAGLGTVDAYINDNLVGNFTLGHGHYNVDHIQLQGIGAGTDWFDFVKIGDKQSRFAQQWIQQHDFTVQALVTLYYTLQNIAGRNPYRDAGFSSLLIWENDVSIFSKNEDTSQLTWHFKVPDNDSCSINLLNPDCHDSVIHDHQWKFDQVTQKFLTYDHEINSTAPYKGIALHLTDEPATVGCASGDEGMAENFEFKVEFQNWLRSNGYPNKFIWGNLKAYPEHSEQEIYANPIGCAGNHPTNYNYEQYVEDYLHIVGPDAISFDKYPFACLESETQNNLWKFYFKNMEVVRGKALERDIPYFAFVQTHGQNIGCTAKEAVRKPTEWDLRMNTNALLAYGFKGINYFRWSEERGQRDALIHLDINKDPFISDQALYNAVQKVTQETKNLGKSLKHLRSVAVRYVRGKNSVGTTNPLPKGTTAVNSPEPCTGSYLTSIRAVVTHRTSREEGDLLLACFTPDEEYDGTTHEGNIYFMIVNLYRATDFTPQAKQDVTLKFDFGSSGITALQRLNQNTGTLVNEVQLVPDGGSRYHITFDLVGGEGYLFKYKIPGESFIGLE